MRIPLLLLGGGLCCAVFAAQQREASASTTTEGPALAVSGVNYVTPCCRAGTLGRIEASVRNVGAALAKNVDIVAIDPPKGIVCRPDKPIGIGGGGYALLDLDFSCANPFEGKIRTEIRMDGRNVFTTNIAVRVMPSLRTTKVSYVPEPVPAKTDYDISAFYFPGWNSMREWRQIWAKCPERRPLLGWYDESNPEVVDWQIKWLVENGIGTLFVDWYWCKGEQTFDHWIKAFQMAKYRRFLKWALLWANHNPKGSHSAEDQRNVTKWWVDNYFCRPEYLKIDGKPVVWIWRSEYMDRDMPEGGCARLLEISRQIAREAGYPGIHFIAVKFPELDCSPALVAKFRDRGFDETGLYHFFGDGSGIAYPAETQFSKVADANPKHWQELWRTGILPFIPGISTGWDETPLRRRWRVHGKNVADFRRICVEAKKFAEETGIRRLCLGPVNEWGEGSYAEPNSEHGFGFYETVRDVFCRKPIGGWPENLTPEDVGLGPYEFPRDNTAVPVTKWELSEVGNGWEAFMGCGKVRRTPEGLSFVTTGDDPAMDVEFNLLDVNRFKGVKVRMKVRNAQGKACLFWARNLREWNGKACMTMPLIADDAFHDYFFDLSVHPLWKGHIGTLRFDPCENAGAEVVISSVGFEPKKIAVDDAVRMKSTEMNRTIQSTVAGVKGGVKVLIMGNSIALHGRAPKLGWTNECGMAASTPEKDFAHLVVRGIESSLGRKADFRIRNIFRFERDYKDFNIESSMAEDIAWAPDYIVIAPGENVPAFQEENDVQAWRAKLIRLGQVFKDANPNVKIVYRSVFWHNRDKWLVAKEAAESVGAAFADLGNGGDDPVNRAKGIFSHPGVAAHPGDRGMAWQADLILRAFGFERTFSDIRIRDPFIVTDVKKKCYWLLSSIYGNAGEQMDSYGNTGRGVMAYRSFDLVHWSDPIEILTLPPKLGCTAVWAPEMHYHNGKWYLFATLTSKSGAERIKPMPTKGFKLGSLCSRGTWIFVADTPEGPFKPVRNGSITPSDWMCLDGTFFKEDGKPYMVFCHEWCQTGDGRMMLAELTEDLSAIKGAPTELFRASSVGKKNFVTDGPFLYRSAKNGSLYMVWSNFGEGGYTVYVKRSESGDVMGPWWNSDILFSKDGGHGMIFRKLDGSLQFLLHQPNSVGNERCRLFDLEDDGKSLRVR